MCKACAAVAEPPRQGRPRLKLWAIEGRYHCGIIGTCLTLGELKVLAGKVGLRTATASPSDYEIHSAMVHLASRDRNVGKALDKLLDRKHAPSIRGFAKAREPAGVAALWREALDQGDVAGPYWAVLSHPATTEAVRNTVFGDVHMLSHQVGAATRSDLRRIHVLEQEKAVLEGKVARQQERLRSEIGCRDAEIGDLRRALDDERNEVHRLAHAAHAASELAALRAMVEELRSHLAIEEGRRRLAEELARQLQSDLCASERDLDLLAAENRTLEAENRLFETRVLTLLTQEADEDGCRDCGRLDLCGRCILVVGGRDRQVHHFRRLVESCNGTFAHHDGGLEESLHRLPALCGGADAVVCPVDCVSHQAHDAVKRLCRRWDKPFVPMRRSGLGALALALESIATARATAILPAS